MRAFVCIRGSLASLFSSVLPYVAMSFIHSRVCVHVFVYALGLSISIFSHAVPYIGSPSHGVTARAASPADQQRLDRLAEQLLGEVRALRVSRPSPQMLYRLDLLLSAT